MMACVPADSNTGQATIKLSHCDGNSRHPNGNEKGSGKDSSSSSLDDDEALVANIGSCTWSWITTESVFSTVLSIFIA